MVRGIRERLRRRRRLASRERPRPEWAPPPVADAPGSPTSSRTAAYRFGTTRTRQPGPFGGLPGGRYASTSGGVSASWPSQKGQAGPTARGRSARSGEIRTRRPVSGSDRHSGTTAMSGALRQPPAAVPLGHQPLVNLLVPGRRPVPRPVGPHPVADDPPERVRPVVVQVRRPPHRRVQRLRRVRLEPEPGRARRRPGTPRSRPRPCRPARPSSGPPAACRTAGCTAGSARTARTGSASGTGRCPASIGWASPSLNPRYKPDLVRVPVADRVQLVVVLGSPSPRTTSWQPQVEEAAARLDDQVDPLLLDQPGDHAEHRRAPARPAGRSRRCRSALHSGLPLERPSRPCTSPAMCGSVRRVPGVVVDAVDDPAQPVADARRAALPARSRSSASGSRGRRSG